jgi:hypothetical protein
MKKAEIKGNFLPWRDFLHEGPVTSGLSLDLLSKIRAKYIASLGFSNFQTINHEFQERNAQLKQYNQYEKVILWFEHDLYDQLQLIQVLSWFAKENLENTNLILIETNNYLGESTEQEIKNLQKHETKVTTEHLSLAEKTWSAFTNERPELWFQLLNKEHKLLPHLNTAVFRLLEEYPNTKNGLSRTEYQALLIVSNGISEPVDIFKKCQSFEERKFMGDIIFFKILERFTRHKVLKKEENSNKLELTLLGKNLLSGKENWLNIKPINHSIGGVKLSKDNLWCWDVPNKNIQQYYYSKALNSFLLVK